MVDEGDFSTSVFEEKRVLRSPRRETTDNNEDDESTIEFSDETDISDQESWV